MLKRPSIIFSTNHQKKNNIPLVLPNLHSRTKSSGKNQIPLPLYQCCCLHAVSVPANALYIIFNIDNGGRGQKSYLYSKKIDFLDFCH